MALTLERYDVRTVETGDGARFDDGVLTVDADLLRRHLLDRDERLSKVAIGVATPGDETRLVCVKDVVQPRHKKQGAAPGEGVLTVLDNVAVATCGPIVGFQEGIIDMSGPGAKLTPFASMPLIVLEISVREGMTAHEHEAAVREAGLEAADVVASSCREAMPNDIGEITWDEVIGESALPRIAYVYLVLSQGLLHDTYVFGESAVAGLPVVVDPRVLMDNAVVSGNCVSACDKNTTYHHQNNPVIADLLAGHGTRWNFVGVVISNEPTRLAEKQLSAENAIKLTVDLAADGAIVSKEGFGNPDTDLMMILGGLEKAGVKAVAITDEFAGADGGSQSLADTTPEADAIVSVGNANERVDLPPMEKIFGPLPDAARLAGGYAHSLRDDGSMEVELQAIVGSTNQLGYSRLSCREI